VPQASTYRPGYEIAAEKIVEFISETGLEPGDRLPTEQDLAQQLGLSRGMVREAIKALGPMGRVSAQRGRGLFVGQGSVARTGQFLPEHKFMPGRMEHVEQLLEFRLVQERFAASQAALRATPSELRELELALDSCDRAVELKNMELWAASDNRFHLGIADACGNFFIRAALENARTLQEQTVLLGLRSGPGGSLESAQSEHREIHRAIRAGDPEEAAAATEVHLRRTIDGYREEIAGILTGKVV
jgi:DNA-binding FadR family transcriptional regulator